MNEYKEPCPDGCTLHKYHCGVCHTAVSYSPANYASRPSDIPNICEYCHPEKNKITLKVMESDVQDK